MIPTPEQIRSFERAMESATDIICECKSKVFVEGVTFKKLSKIILGCNEDKIVKFPSFFCAKCGKEFGETDAEKKLVSL